MQKNNGLFAKAEQINLCGLIGMALSPWIGQQVIQYANAHHVDSNVMVLCVLGVFWTLFEFGAIAGNTIFTALINDVVPQNMLGRFYGLFRISYFLRRNIKHLQQRQCLFRAVKLVVLEHLHDLQNDAEVTAYRHFCAVYVNCLRKIVIHMQTGALLPPPSLFRVFRCVLYNARIGLFLFVCKRALQMLNQSKKKVSPNGETVRKRVQAHSAEYRSANISIEQSVDFLARFFVHAPGDVENFNIFCSVNLCFVCLLLFVHVVKRRIYALDKIHVRRRKRYNGLAVDVKFFYALSETNACHDLYLL